MRFVRWALSSPAYMWLRGALSVGCFVILCSLGVACGGEGGVPSQSRESQPPAATDTNATSPDPAPSAPTTEPPKEESPPAGEASVLTASPACAPIGSRVVLKLGMTRDHRSVDCYDVDVVVVSFAPQKLAKVTVMGPMSDGFCAIDVEVPKGAESGKITVAIGADTFETEAAFPVPCP